MQNRKLHLELSNIMTVEPAHVITSIKQLSVLKGHFFLSCHRKFHMNWTSFKRSPVLKDHFSLSQRWPLNTGLTLYTGQNRNISVIFFFIEFFFLIFSLIISFLILNFIVLSYIYQLLNFHLSLSNNTELHLNMKTY